MKRAVVKLGGSTANAVELDLWIAALASSSLPLVIVPGGGPFADQVRDTQKTMGFSDKAAHAMAILAMDQFGHVLLDRHERLVPARSFDEMEQALKLDKIPVWLPSTLAIPAPDIETSWTVTSDSLAAWFAGKIGADSLLLLKQSSAFRGSDTIADLMLAGIVDAAFGSMLPAGIDFYLAGPHHAAKADATLASGNLPGIRIASILSARRTG